MDESVKTAAQSAVAQRRFRPKLAFYHANGKGTGAALKMELHPAHDDTDGSIMATIAGQMAVGDRTGPAPVYPRFDWESAICVKLDFSDLTQILQVLRGTCESVADGRGLCHTSPRGTSRILVRHFIEPRPCYSFEVYRSGRAGGEESSARIFLSQAEACGLEAAITGSLAVVCFGIPTVIPHDTSAYRAETREMRDAPAA